MDIVLLGGQSSRPLTASVEPYKYSLQARSFSLQGWGLIDLLRASNEGLRRPRVARAQKIIRLHSFLCLLAQGTNVSASLQSSQYGHWSRC